MADIKLKVGSQTNQMGQGGLNKQEPQEPPITIKLKVRRALNGDLMIGDHPEMDIVLSLGKNKIMLFTKEGNYGDHVYSLQNRCFEFLNKKGIIDPGSIKGTNVYGGFEASLLKPEQEENIPLDQMVLLNIRKFIDEEMPDIEFNKKFAENYENYLLGKDEEGKDDEDETTPLGKVPQAAEKGTLDKYGRKFHQSWYE